MIAAALCAVLLVPVRGSGVAPIPAQEDPAVAREWDVRRRVLEPRAHAPALLERAHAADWTARAAAWETLVRADRVHPGVFAREVEGAPGAGRRGESAAEERAPAASPPAPWVSALRAALDDAHPNVRALALEFLAEYPAWVALDGPAARRLATDPLPQVRIALARVLDRQAGPLAVDVLARLAEDPDPRVGTRARRALFRQERSAEPAKFAALERFDPREERAAFAERLSELAAGEPTATVLRALEERVAGDAGLAALVASLGVRTDTGGDAESLARGWLEVGALPASARSLTREAVARIGADAGRALVRRAREVEGAPAWRTLFDGALDALAPEEFLAAVEDAALAPEAELVAWEALAGRSAAWTPERVAPWLAPGRDPRLREAVATAVFDGFGAREDPRTGELVAGLLDDEHLGDEAFDVLCSARDPLPWLDELYRAWLRLPPEERLVRTRRLPRDVPLAPFRAEFLRTGREQRAARNALAELLAPFAEVAGDASEEVRAALLEWLSEEVAAVSLGISRETPEWRASELRAIGLARALAAFDPPRTAPVLREATFTLGDVSVEFGKVAAWALGQSAAGRVELASVLRSELPRRVRIEAASWLARDGDPAAVALLQRAYPTCDQELRERILREFGELSDESSASFLAAVAADPRAPSGLRISAASSLERRGAAAALVGAIRTEADVDVRVALVESLGRSGDAALAEAELLPELVALEAERPGRLAGADAPDEVRAALREAVLAALAAAGSSAEELRAAWLRRPLERSAGDLSARFGVLPLASTTFSHRAELSVAEHLARAGELSNALAAAGPWWRSPCARRWWGTRPPRSAWPTARSRRCSASPPATRARSSRSAPSCSCSSSRSGAAPGRCSRDAPSACAARSARATSRGAPGARPSARSTGARASTPTRASRARCSRLGRCPLSSVASVRAPSSSRARPSARSASRAPRAPPRTGCGRASPRIRSPRRETATATSRLLRMSMQKVGADVP